jgi:hypothetical protein
MEYALFAIPILPGKTEAAREFQRDLMGSHREAYEESERNLAITKEVWALQSTPQGDLFTVFFQSDHLAASVGKFVASHAPFDLWFKARLKLVTGVDLNEPPSGPFSEILSAYEA